MSSFHWIETYNKYIEYKHFACHFKDSKILYKVVTIYPYCFKMFYEDNKTRISKSIVRSEIKKNGKETAYSSEEVNILEIDSIIEFPWSNKDQVLDKLKLYSIFS